MDLQFTHYPFKKKKKKSFKIKEYRERKIKHYIEKTSNLNKR